MQMDPRLRGDDDARAPRIFWRIRAFRTPGQGPGYEMRDARVAVIYDE